MGVDEDFSIVLSCGTPSFCFGNGEIRRKEGNYYPENADATYGPLYDPVARKQLVLDLSGSPPLRESACRPPYERPCLRKYHAMGSL